MNSDANTELMHSNIDIEETGEMQSNGKNECETYTSYENISRTGNLEEKRSSIMEQERAIKRGREVDPEEIWSTVSRKSKKFGRAGGENEETRIPEDTVEVCVTGMERLPKQFGLAKSLKQENIQNIIRIKYVNAYKVLIQFSDEDSAETLVQSKKFNENGLKCHKTLEINQSYGVINNVDLDLSEEEILVGLSSETVIIAVKRLKRRNRNDGHWEPSEFVRICFKGPSLPRYIYIYDTRAQVSPYIYPVTQCSRCWRFGHSIRMCPSLKIICPKCTRPHANCETTTFKCNNCAGQHMAMAKICPVFKKEKRIRELMSEFNVSYKKAITIYVPPSPTFIPLEEEQLFNDTQKDKETRNNPPNLEEIVMEAEDTLTYANITKGPQEKPKKKSKAEKRRNRAEKRNIIQEKEDEISEITINESDPEENTQSKSKMNAISWQMLLNKLKEKLLAAESNSWSDKVKACFGVVLEGIFNFIMQLLGDLPVCNLIKQLWITTDHAYQ